MRTLITESFVIEDPSACIRHSDPLVEEIPQTSEIYICQEDTTFGRNVYHVLYLSSSHSFLMRAKNLTSLRFYLVFSVRPGKFRSFVLVVPYEDGLIVYGMTYDEWKEKYQTEASAEKLAKFDEVNPGH